VQRRDRIVPLNPTNANDKDKGKEKEKKRKRKERKRTLPPSDTNQHVPAASNSLMDAFILYCTVPHHWTKQDDIRHQLAPKWCMMNE
jgi:hypothetical protein